MLEIIVFIIIIMAVVQSSKKKNTRRQAPPFTARPQRPSGSFSSRPAQPSKPLVSGARQKKQKKNASGRKAEGASPVQASGGQSAETRTFIEPTRPYQPARNAGDIISKMRRSASTAIVGMPFNRRSSQLHPRHRRRPSM